MYENIKCGNFEKIKFVHRLLITGQGPISHHDLK